MQSERDEKQSKSFMKLEKIVVEDESQDGKEASQEDDDDGSN